MKSTGTKPMDRLTCLEVQRKRIIGEFVIKKRNNERWLIEILP